VKLNDGDKTQYLSKNYYKHKHSKRKGWRGKMNINTEIYTSQLSKAARFNSSFGAVRQLSHLQLSGDFEILKVKHSLEIMEVSG
jgi:hypothetical protein